MSIRLPKSIFKQISLTEFQEEDLGLLWTINNSISSEDKIIAAVTKISEEFEPLLRKNLKSHVPEGLEPLGVLYFDEESKEEAEDVANKFELKKLIFHELFTESFLLSSLSSKKTNN